MSKPIITKNKKFFSKNFVYLKQAFQEISHKKIVQNLLKKYIKTIPLYTNQQNIVKALD